MTEHKLFIKTPKQLHRHLTEKAHWTKQSIIDLLVFAEVEKEEILKKMTYLQLCEKYHDDIVELVWEEYRN